MTCSSRIFTLTTMAAFLSWRSSCRFGGSSIMDVCFQEQSRPSPVRSRRSRGTPRFDLVCPIDRLGAVDVYLVTHHGGNDAGDRATFAVIRPRVAIVNNGPKKGGAAVTLAALQQMPAIDVWQLHRSDPPGAQN